MDTSSNSDTLVRVRGLRKHYGAIRAVDGISFTVGRGDVLGFLGPNGAGKTTAMKLITGFLEPDEGSIEISGHDVATASLEARKKIGYLPENAPAYGEMTVDGFLGFIAAARGIEDREPALDRAVGLTELGKVRRQTIDTLSKGFKRRVGLAQALIHDPEILILDEPTDGLDPNQKALVQDLLTELSPGRAIILSTHILDEAEKICNRALIISEGKIVVDSTPRELITRASSHNVIRCSVDPEALPRLLEVGAREEWCERVETVSDSTVDFYPGDGQSHLAELLQSIDGIQIRDISLREGRLDELFRELTKGVAA